MNCPGVESLVVVVGIEMFDKSLGLVNRLLRGGRLLGSLFGNDLLDSLGLLDGRRS